MTTNASGVKVYRNLPHATIFNFNLEFKQSFLTYFNWSDNLSYGYGRDYSNMPLPLIAPVSYTSALDFNIKQFHTGVAIQGAAKQYFFSADYGEDSTPAYCIVNSSMGYDFHYKKCPVNVKVGVENMLDKKYSTYSDWNNIPRKGRNVYFSIGINIE
jgi:iron complex outermembrane receptor protein